MISRCGQRESQRSHRSAVVPVLRPRTASTWAASAHSVPRATEEGEQWRCLQSPSTSTSAQTLHKYFLNKPGRPLRLPPTNCWRVPSPRRVRCRQVREVSCTCGHCPVSQETFYPGHQMHLHAAAGAKKNVFPFNSMELCPHFSV